MARIPLLSYEELSDAQRAVYDEVVNNRGKLYGPLRAALHNPELADKWQKFGELLRYRTSLSARLSELAILVTARYFDCQFEWYAHEPHALNGGLSQPVIDAIKLGERPVFDKEDEAAIYDYVLELHQTHFVGPEKYQRVLDLLGVAGVVELTAIMGYYSLVAMTLNVHELPLPEGAEPPLKPITTITAA